MLMATRTANTTLYYVIVAMSGLAEHHTVVVSADEQGLPQAPSRTCGCQCATIPARLGMR